jgi:hypothetical protein
MTSIQHEIEALSGMTTTELVRTFGKVCGYRTNTRHRAYLIRKIAWRIQANAEGDLSDRAKKRARELANDAEVRLMAPKGYVVPPGDATAGREVVRAVTVEPPRDGRIPPPGSAIVREYRGRKIRVSVLPDGEGFEWDGERYSTLSAVARAVSGTHTNGFRFFGLGGGR